MTKPHVKKTRVVVIVGPTASGKSDLAVRIARAFNGEVVSADSRQVYRGLDIGTGKITKREMRGIPHHLLDVADPRRSTYTAADFKRDATRSVQRIAQNGKLPIICGGTGFYIDVFLGRVTAPAVPPDRTLRAKLGKKTAKQIFSTLKKLDPQRARSIDFQNKHRLIRAIEIAKALGKVPRTGGENLYETLWVGLAVPRAELRKKISKRLRVRIRSGMVAEAKKLHACGLSWKRMRELGLEYRWLARYLRKKISQEAFISGLERDSWRYAKRQMTWFKRNKNIRWINPSETVRAKLFTRTFLRS